MERPDGGDPARLIGPTMEGHALWWGVASRDKLCVSLNLKDAGDRDRLLDLIAEADVFVENYRPGVLERLGLGWDTLVARNPRLVGMSISGFGQSGPYAGRPGFGKIAECFSGIVPVTGAPQDPPLHVGFSLADTSAGLMGAMAINMALYRCDCGGGGAVRIDVGLYEPLFRMMETQFALLAATGAAPIRQGTNDPYGWGAPDATNRRFVPVTCRDGAEVLVLMDEDAAGGIAALAGADDEAGLRSWAATVDVGEAAEAMRRHGIEAARIHGRPVDGARAVLPRARRCPRRDGAEPAAAGRARAGSSLSHAGAPRLPGHRHRGGQRDRLRRGGPHHGVHGVTQTFIVTGGSRGIGAATVERAARDGHAVCFSYGRDEDAARRVVAHAEEAGARVLAVKADMGTEEGVAALFAACDEAFGRPDVLVNNAGITGRLGPVADLEADDLARVLAINVAGVLLACREAVRRMSTERGGAGGAIVNVSSRAAALGGATEWVHYAASKGAVDTLTVGLAREVSRDGIRVNAVRPGLIDTEIHARAGAPDRLARFAPGVPLGRPGTADEVAETIVWLASAGASYVSGALLDVGGGR